MNTTSTKSAKETNMRVVMLPRLAHGHISPYLELAKKLIKRNIIIYLCSTPTNLNSISKRITQQQSLSINIVQIHLPSSPDLPPNLHTSNSLPRHLLPALESAFESAIPNHSSIIKTLKPDVIIYDQPWAPAIIAEHKIPAVEFLTSSAACTSLVIHGSTRPGIEYPYPEILLTGYHDMKLRRWLHESKFLLDEKKKSADSDWQKSCKILLFNTFRELERKYIDYLSSVTGKKIVPIGPLVPEFANETDEETKEVMNWLDKRNDSSGTVFVSFGSEWFLTKEEIEEVAHGLELSGLDFILVVRFPVGEKTEAKEALPKDFLERVGDKGLVLEGWAPQAQTLAHSKIGGFLSHCGWNSILESLKFGVPIIAMPVDCDQPGNCKLLKAVGVAVEVEREEDGRLNRYEIARGIKKVVVEESGEGIRVKAKEFMEKIKFIGEEGITELVEELVQLCKEYGKKAE
ncbi:hypothetical protein RHGRI_038168 [Rhododendron griersonianum]|uniref:Glycosyltransferase N-terminal domain-containing protein n=1 Tax=Rhododendron griersonianum TaxID=479676 RepID=A0AAV6HY36_9ERIC|nr:hypothetical protein RHGRI_038168 [Rhododendron griersonianum]